MYAVETRPIEQVQASHLLELKKLGVVFAAAML
jgi:hypothetical protein